PYDRRFFRRDVAIPALGFDVFLDEANTEFTSAERIGRYISDRAVGQVLLDRIRQSGRPSLFYAVTMENHGPWTDIDNYLEHVYNSDRLLGMVIESLDDSGRDYVLAFFGDHRPALRNVASRGETPFVILRNIAPTSSVPPVTVSAAQLNELLITAITS
ncbi:MAG: LTA synthase family protein, partial [Bradyrhizobium sp.]|uniref:sulfatase-like hydrolase/transferase n=1 Tax=Bradyrhizobium sp. TaxID=376 RepID=UPI001211A245